MKRENELCMSQLETYDEGRKMTMVKVKDAICEPIKNQGEFCVNQSKGRRNVMWTNEKLFHYFSAAAPVAKGKEIGR